MNLPVSPVYYVTGPLHSGKTTRLRQWSESRADVAGVFQPVMDRKRYFIDIQTGKRVLMDAPLEEGRAYDIGKYRFAIGAFEWAGQVLESALEKPETRFLIVDEIGPLEMRGDGLDDTVQRLLSRTRPEVALILVIRDYLLEEVLERYSLTGKAMSFEYPEAQ